MGEMEEESGKKAVLFRLFGVEVHGEPADEDEEPFELKKSTSMPNLAGASIDPLLTRGEASNDKGYASDDDGLASTPQLKRRRRKAQERKKGTNLTSLFRSQTHWSLLLSCSTTLLFYSFVHVPITVI
jgi:hypothetical protein